MMLTHSTWAVAARCNDDLALMVWVSSTGYNLIHGKRPEFPSGMSLASRPNMPSWVFQRKRDLSDRFAGGGQCRRSGG